MVLILIYLACWLVASWGAYPASSGALALAVSTRMCAFPAVRLAAA
jgi:hypothetical protein